MFRNYYEAIPKYGVYTYTSIKLAQSAVLFFFLRSVRYGSINVHPYHLYEYPNLILIFNPYQSVQAFSLPDMALVQDRVVVITGASQIRLF